LPIAVEVINARPGAHEDREALTRDGAELPRHPVWIMEQLTGLLFIQHAEPRRLRRLTAHFKERIRAFEPRLNLGGNRSVYKFGRLRKLPACRSSVVLRHQAHHTIERGTQVSAGRLIGCARQRIDCTGCHVGEVPSGFFEDISNRPHGRIH
jgi:hypothetical protein